LKVDRDSLLGTGLMVWGSNPRGSELFRSRPEQPWGPPNLIYNGFRIFHRGTATGAWRWPFTPIQGQG